MFYTISSGVFSLLTWRKLPDRQSYNAPTRGKTKAAWHDLIDETVHGWDPFPAADQVL